MQETIRKILASSSYDGMLTETISDVADAIAKALQNETQVLTCVYCGMAYEPGTPTSNHEALTAHISQCEKHPVFQLRKENNELLAKNKAMQKALSSISSTLPMCLSDLIGRDLYLEIYGEDG